jgi:hypothetical protein
MSKTVVKGLLRSLARTSRYWEKPTSEFLDFTSLTFFAFKYFSECTLKWDDFDLHWTEILTPNKKYSDVQNWSGNTRAQSLIRRIFLERKYGSSAVMKAAIDRFCDPSYIPQREEVVEFFDMKDWTRNPEGEDARKDQLLRSLKTEHDSIADWSLEDILESAGCCVYGRNEFNWFCERFERYEFLTSTYIDALSAYIKERAVKNKNEESDFIVLEVGAGSGVLSESLQTQLRDENIFILATDPNYWKLKKHFHVDRFDHKEAVKMFQPNLVIASWMPLGEDWTRDIRAAGVKEYVLIGEADGGCCGDPWKTWGIHGNATSNRLQPPFRVDGYDKVYLETLSAMQLQRYDSAHWNQNSQTVSFQMANDEK